MGSRTYKGPTISWSTSTRWVRDTEKGIDREILEVKLPRSFYWDHVARDLPAGELVRDCKGHVVVALDQENYDELLSDAKFYSALEMDPPQPGLSSSAKATVVKLDKVDRPGIRLLAPPKKHIVYEGPEGLKRTFRGI